MQDANGIGVDDGMNFKGECHWLFHLFNEFPIVFRVAGVNINISDGSFAENNKPASNGFCVYGGFPARDAAMSKLFSQLSWYRNPLKSSKGDTRSLAPQRVLEP